MSVVYLVITGPPTHRGPVFFCSPCVCRGLSSVVVICRRL